MLCCRATHDWNSEQTNSNYHVSDDYLPLEFKIGFNPKEPAWKKMRNAIQAEINKRYPDEQSKWVWGMYGMGGRVSKLVLYDYYGTAGSAQFDCARKSFADAVAGPGTKLSLKVKWSWTENASFMRKADLRTVNVNATVADSMLARRLELKKVHILEYSRVPMCFDKALLECPDLAQCRKCLGEERVKHKSCAKIFVPPELYAATVYEMERDDEKFQSRHVVASDEFLEVVRTVVARDTEKADKIKEKRCDELNIRPPVMVKNTFLTINLPPGSMVSSISMKRHALSAPARIDAWDD